MVSVSRSNPRSVRRGDQRALRQVKVNIEKSKDRLFFVKHIAAGSAQAKCYLVQVDIEQWYIVTMI